MDERTLLKPLEGQLSKYTNVIQGWQFRWFHLDPQKGYLNYYLSETETHQKPRGSVYLSGAQIAPSDEDSHTFTVSSDSNELYKLRAQDAKERQLWVDKLRAVSQRHTEAAEIQANPSVSVRFAYSSLSVMDSFVDVQRHLDDANRKKKKLDEAIEALPSSGPTMKCTDKEVLMIKATANSTVQSLEECLKILQHQQYAMAVQPPVRRTPSPSPSAKMRPLRKPSREAVRRRDSIKSNDSHEDSKSQHM